MSSISNYDSYQRPGGNYSDFFTFLSFTPLMSNSTRKMIKQAYDEIINSPKKGCILKLVSLMNMS